MRNTRVRLWAALAAAVVLAALAALTGLGAVISIFAPRDRDVAGGIVLAIVSIAVLVACVRWAVHSEHRLRRRHAADARDSAAGDAAVGAAGAGAELDAALSARRTRRPRTGYAGTYRWHHHRHGPVTTAVGGVVLSLVAIGMVIGAIVQIYDWRLSRFVQAHGDRRTATVISVNEIVHHGRSSTWYTADIGVLLSAPVGGHTATTVHYPGRSTLATGDRVTVLVDPDQPGYAELPGSEYTGVATWIALLGFAAFTLPFACLYWYEVVVVRIRKRRRAGSAGSELAGAQPTG